MNQTPIRPFHIYPAFVLSGLIHEVVTGDKVEPYLTVIHRIERRKLARDAALAPPDMRPGLDRKLVLLDEAFVRRVPYTDLSIADALARLAVMAMDPDPRNQKLVSEAMEALWKSRNEQKRITAKDIAQADAPVVAHEEDGNEAIRWVTDYTRSWDVVMSAVQGWAAKDPVRWQGFIAMLGNIEYGLARERPEDFFQASPFGTCSPRHVVIALLTVAAIERHPAVV